MNKTVKLVVYVLLIAGVIGFGYAFSRTYSQANQRAPDDSPTNAISTIEANVPPSTNVQSSATNAQTPPTTNALPAPVVAVANAQAKGASGMMAYGAVCFAAILGIGLLLAHDLTQFFAHRVEKFIFNEDLEGVKDPEYEEAEHVWANGNHLEAIQLMRDYLKRNPREQYVALRIAEIYEGDLGNYLAAALEYEEILKKNLPPERWGWAAIHLVNLYSGKLNKVPEATALLQRIADEYGQTAAAKKARERLGLPEPIAPEPEPAEEPAPEETPPAPPSSNLPPGFRPK